MAAAQRVVVERVESRRRSARRRRPGRGRGTPWSATAALSPVTTLTVIPRPARRRSASRGVGLGRVEEDQEAREVQVPLVGRPSARRSSGARPGRDRDDAVAGGELGVQRGARRGGHVDAALQHGLRRALGDQRRRARRPSRTRTETIQPLVVERAAPPSRVVAGQRGALGRGGRRVATAPGPAGCRRRACPPAVGVLGAQQAPAQHARPGRCAAGRARRACSRSGPG